MEVTEKLFEIIRPEGTKQVSAVDVGDGYHRMSDLYKHRHHLFIALVRVYDNYITPLGCRIVCWKTKKHHDGTMHPGDFLLGMTVTKSYFQEPDKTFDISYHLPIDYWHQINVMELAHAAPWDGYTSEDVLQRLLSL